MSVRVIRPGLQTTVQDLGRKGFRQYGVNVCGAMDPFALRCANLLVGNAEGEAALEFAVGGPELYFADSALIAITGGDFPVRLDGRPLDVLWRPFIIRAGSVLSIGTARSGVRGYLAVSGGFDIPPVMGSRSTDLRAKFGGLDGRPLKAGDLLRLRRESEFMREMGDGENGPAFEPGSIGGGPLLCPKAVSGQFRPLYGAHPYVRVLRGPHFGLLDEESRERFLSAPYRVRPQSDRMGYRLDGPPLHLSVRREMVSEAVAFGTVQLPPDGQPIILMADHAVTGGYPNIAHVITSDLPLVAQTPAGEDIRFREVSIAEAQELIVSREMELRQLKAAMAIERKAWRQWREPREWREQS